MTQAIASAERRAATPVAAPGEFLTFKLGAEEYGIDILKVQEIKGVVNLRGVIVPIVDLRIKFGLGEPHYDALTVVIILNVARRIVGIVVDSVSDVLALEAEQIQPAPEFNQMLDASYITGLGSVQTGEGVRMLILADIERLMSAGDMGLVDAAALH